MEKEKEMEKRRWWWLRRSRRRWRRSPILCGLVAVASRSPRGLWVGSGMTGIPHSEVTLISLQSACNSTFLCAHTHTRTHAHTHTHTHTQSAIRNLQSPVECHAYTHTHDTPVDLSKTLGRSGDKTQDPLNTTLLSDNPTTPVFSSPRATGPVTDGWID